MIKKILPNLELVQKTLLDNVWKWAIPLIATVIVGVVPQLRDALWNAGCAHYSIPGWALFALTLGSGLAVSVVIHWMWRHRGPEFMRKFREGEYDGLIWTWKWRSDQRVDQESLQPFCPICRTELRIQTGLLATNESATTCYCTSCNKDIIGYKNVVNLPDHVWRKIEAEVRNATWKKRIRHTAALPKST